MFFFRPYTSSQMSPFVLFSFQVSLSLSCFHCIFSINRLDVVIRVCFLFALHSIAKDLRRMLCVVLWCWFSFLFCCCCFWSGRKRLGAKFLADNRSLCTNHFTHFSMCTCFRNDVRDKEPASDVCYLSQVNRFLVIDSKWVNPATKSTFSDENDEK